MPLNKPKIQKGTYLRRETKQDIGMHSLYFPLIFFILLSLCFFSLPQWNVYFSSSREAGRFRFWFGCPQLIRASKPDKVQADSCINHSPLELIGGSIKIQPPASDHPGSLYRNRSIQSYLTQLKLYSHLKHLTPHSLLLYGGTGWGGSLLATQERPVWHPDYNDSYLALP